MGWTITIDLKYYFALKLFTLNFMSDEKRELTEITTKFHVLWFFENYKSDDIYLSLRK